MILPCLIERLKDDTDGQLCCPYERLESLLPVNRKLLDANILTKYRGLEKVAYTHQTPQTSENIEERWKALRILLPSIDLTDNDILLLHRAVRINHAEHTGYGYGYTPQQRLLTEAVSLTEAVEISVGERWFCLFVVPLRMEYFETLHFRADGGSRENNSIYLYQRLMVYENVDVNEAEELVTLVKLCI